MEYMLVAIIGFIAALTPGPDIFFVIRCGLIYGLKKSLLAVLGILTGNIVYLSLVYLGLGYIGKLDIFQIIVGIFGGIYLMILAFKIFKEDISDISQKIDSNNIYLSALMLNLSNPKAMLFFSIIITPFINGNLINCLFSLFIGIALAFLLASILSSKISLEINILRIFNKLAAVIFFIFSIKLFQTALFHLF
ncbi:LysE family translocator [Methanocaldococcus indicus]|uniref:LysE family translocator n=1 Tax=Methanocaldococcus indicus TaxID=213231 RepID=UPI003C6D6836